MASACNRVFETNETIIVQLRHDSGKQFVGSDFQVSAQLAQVQSASLRIFLVDQIDKLRRARNQLVPVALVGCDFASQSDLTAISQFRESVRDFIGAEIRFGQQRFAFSEAVPRELRSNTKSDVVWRSGTRS